MLTDISSKKMFLILGYGISGRSVCNFLKKHGHEVIVYDDNIENTHNCLESVDFSKIDAVIKSPGVPFMEHNQHFIVKKAKLMNIPIISGYDIFMLYNPNACVVSITATNGKSTTTALVQHILKKSGINSSMGGNIGVPYFDLPKSDVYVFEMSSYELACSKYMKFHSACVLNIEPDHLENHGTFENYINAKQSSLEYAKNRFISYEDEYAMKKYKNQKNIITISNTGNKNADIYVCDGLLMDKNDVICDLSAYTELRGKHNHQNAAFAYAICKNLGVFPKEISKNMATFKSLPHRLHIVRKIENILFVNDSKATNPDSAAKALDTYVGYNIFWIVGGRSKKTDPHESVDKYLESVRKMYLFGESADEFFEHFKHLKSCEKYNSMFEAVLNAYSDALKEKEGPSVVLLSPMCSSFDQFQNFEHRGEEFCKMVNEL